MYSPEGFHILFVNLLVVDQHIRLCGKDLKGKKMVRIT